MIITKLYGGLGNQMYQYAAGKALAAKLFSNLYMDLSWFEGIKGSTDTTQRTYELDGFGIEPTSMTILDKLSYKTYPPKRFKEEHIGYNKPFERLTGNLIIDGYWQSYKYFDRDQGLIHEEFNFPEKISKSNAQMLDRINKSESVSIHVRRGDYNTKRGRSYHGLMPTAYYTKALNDLNKKIDKPTLFIFSDEIEWCKSNLRFKEFPSVYVDSNSPNTGVEDMRLMSACKHNIIANSSFSWWAAWLNNNPLKIIYAPATWFSKEEYDINDRIPRKWIII